MSRAAPLADAWRRRTGGAPGLTGAGPPAEGTAGPFFEIFVDEAWIDITAYVYTRGEVTITRGQTAESSQVQPTTVSLQINNANGRFSPRNPLSPLYSKIGRNTPLRISRRVNGVTRYRFHGEIASWPTRWDTSGRDAWVDIEASGILRRLEQGAKPLRSALLREISTLASPYPFYWPLEEGSGAVFGGGRLTGTPSSFGESQAPAGSAGAASFEGTSSTVSRMQASATISSGSWVVACWIYTPSPSDLGSTGESPLISVETPGGSTAKKWGLRVAWNSPTAHSSRLEHVEDTGSGSFNGAIGDRTGGHMHVMHSYQDGGDWVVELYVDGVSVTSHSVTDTASPIDSIKINFHGNPSVPPDIKGSISHLIVAGGDRLADILGHVDAGTGHSGETAGRRLQRLCNEEGVVVLPLGDLDDTEAMGPQTRQTLTSLLRECAAADLGLLFEPRDALGLAYRTRVSLYNQDPALSLSYDAGQLAGALTPVPDDQQTRNDITVERPSGSSARAVQQTGPLSIQPPPAGVGSYDEQVSVNIETDARLGDHATWRLSLGTVDEDRYPQIPLQLADPVWTADPAQLAAALATDIGDRVVIDDLPPEVPPDPVSQILIGYSENLAQFTHAITLIGTPESPYRVAVWDADHYDTAGSELAADVSDSATTLSVATTLGPVWTQDAADLPFDVMCGGERMTVTAISGASSPQTFTVTRSVNAIVKGHLAGTSLSLADPVRWAL